MTILVDKAYEDASQRAADWAERQVRQRFAEVYGDRADEVLAKMRQRMESNILSDGRMTEPEASE